MIIELEDSVGYVVKPCLKKNPTKLCTRKAVKGVSEKVLLKTQRQE
jgi:hypothetical protein